tara:strand:- start:728 stop:1039 length:312 start_codon:yes stop_codon:yes gene_type:complete
LKVILPDIGADPDIIPDVVDNFFMIARVEIDAPSKANNIARCFSNHSERKEYGAVLDIETEDGNGFKENFSMNLWDENNPQEFDGIPISGSGCKRSIESFVSS